MTARVLLPFVVLLLSALACGDGYSRAEVRYNLGRELAAQGDLEEAIDEFNLAIELDPGLTPGYYARALVYLRLGEIPDAADDLTAVIRLDPGHADAYRYRITTDMLTGDLERAFEDSMLLAHLRATPP
jgi:tetratricopeptide (TPR) repeat protein